MVKLLGLMFVSLACVVPALAQDAPQGQSPAPNATQDEARSDDAQSLQRTVQAQLAQAGYTNIHIIPATFLVRAKDADGNEVMLMLSPDWLSDLDIAPDTME